MMSAAAALCSCCPALADLNLSSNQSLDDRHLEGILSACSALHFLQATGCSSIRSVFGPVLAKRSFMHVERAVHVYVSLKKMQQYAAGLGCTEPRIPEDVALC